MRRLTPYPAYAVLDVLFTISQTPARGVNSIINVVHAVCDRGITSSPQTPMAPDIRRLPPASGGRNAVRSTSHDATSWIASYALSVGEENPEHAAALRINHQRNIRFFGSFQQNLPPRVVSSSSFHECRVMTSFRYETGRHAPVVPSAPARQKSGPSHASASIGIATTAKRAYRHPAADDFYPDRSGSGTTP